MICPAVTAGVVMVPHPWAAWESQMSLDPSIKMTVRTPGWSRASRPNRVIPVSPTGWRPKDAGTACGARGAAAAAAQVVDLAGPLATRPGVVRDPVLRMRAYAASNSASLARKAL